MNESPTLKTLIVRERERMAAAVSRRAALSEALAQFGRLERSVDTIDRMMLVRRQMNDADAEIGERQARIENFEREQSEDERVDALARISLRSGATRPEDMALLDEG